MPSGVSAQKDSIQNAARIAATGIHRRVKGKANTADLNFDATNPFAKTGPHAKSLNARYWENQKLMTYIEMLRKNMPRFGSMRKRPPPMTAQMKASTKAIGVTTRA